MKSYSSDLIDRVINHYKTTNDSLRRTGKLFQIGKSSIWRWLKERPNDNKPLKPVKISHLKDWIIKTILDQPFTRLKDLSKEIMDQFNVNVSISTLSRFLSKERISSKKTRKKTNRTTNTEEIKNRFKEDIKSIGYDNILSFDEVGFQLEMYPHKGWSKKGDRCYYQSNKGGRTNYTGSFMISTNGIVHWTLSKRAMNVDGMLSFLSEFDGDNNANKTLVMDNLRVHHNKDVKQKIQDLKIECKFVPPYSPELNPIEEMFSWLKRELRYKIIKDEKTLKEYLFNKIKDINEKGLLCYFKHAYD